jgi:hypothetical protein
MKNQTHTPRKLLNLILGFLVLISFTSACKKKEASLDPNYNHFKILSVKVVNLMFKDEYNKAWDTLDGPDVYFNIETKGNNIKRNGINSCKDNVTASNLPLMWDINEGYAITNLSETQYIILYDIDTLDPTDRMGFVTFTMDAHKSGYPTTISKSNAGITVTINGEWY